MRRNITFRRFLNPFLPMKIVKLLCLFLLTCAAVNAQQTGIKGTVKDAETGEALIGVNVILSNGKGAATDTSGVFFHPG